MNAAEQEIMAQALYEAIGKAWNSSRLPWAKVASSDRAKYMQCAACFDEIYKQLKKGGPIYKCSDCKDTGLIKLFTSTERCKCELGKLATLGAAAPRT